MNLGRWGRRGQVFMLVKSANNTWYPIPVVSNKVTSEVADNIIETLADPGLDLQGITQALNPYIFATNDKSKKGAVLIEVNDNDASFVIKGKTFYLSDIKEGKNIAELKEQLEKLNQNIDVSKINTKEEQERLKQNQTLTTNAWTDLDGNYLVQPYIRVNPLPAFEAKEEETDEQGNPITTITLSDINGTTDTKADIEKRRQEEFAGLDQQAMANDSAKYQKEYSKMITLGTDGKVSSVDNKKIEALLKQLQEEYYLPIKNIKNIKGFKYEIELLNGEKLPFGSIMGGAIGQNLDWINRVDNIQGLVATIMNTDTANFGKTVNDKINAKYDAELAALNNKGTTIEQDYEEPADIDDLVDKPQFAAKKDFKKEDTKEFKTWLKNTLPQFGLTVADFAKVKGLSSRSYGQFRNMMIYLNTVAPKGTGFHEAFHGVFRTLLTEEEQSALMKEAKSKYKAPTEQELSALEQHYKKEYGIEFNKQQLNDLYYEEKLADDFADYSETFNSKSLSQKIKDFFNKILNWFGLVTKANNSKIENLFESVNQGKYKAKKPLFKSNKFQPADKMIDPKNVNSSAQDAVVSSLAGQFANSLFKKISLGVSPESRTLSYSIFKEIFDYYKGLKEEGNLNKAKTQVVNSILGNFSDYADATFKYLAQRGVNVERDFSVKEGKLVQELDTEIDITEDKTTKGYGEQVSIPGFKTASPRLKLFLSDIPALDAKGNPKSFLGKTAYVDMVNLYYYLEDNLVGIYNFEDQIDEMRILAKSRPEVQGVIDKLLTQPNISKEEQTRIQNDFKTNFSKQLLGYTLVKFTTDHKTKTTTFEVLEANRQNFGREIYTEWLGNLEDVNRVTIATNEPGKKSKIFGTDKAKSLNTKVEKLVEKINPTKDKSGKLIPSKYTPDFDEINSLFTLAGIEFNDDVLTKNLNDPELYKAFQGYTEWLATAEPNIEKSSEEEKKDFNAKEKIGKQSLSLLTRYQVKGMYKGYTTSFNNVENESVYAVQLPNFQSKLFAKLTNIKSSNPEDKDAPTIAQVEIEALQKDVFLQNNLILNDLKNPKFAEEEFKFTALDGLKNSKGVREGLKFSDMTAKDFLATNIALFQNKASNTAKKGTNASQIAKIPFLTPADKSMLYYFDVIKRNFALMLDAEGNTVVNPGTGELTNFVNAALSETNRMRSALKTKEDFYKGTITLENLYENYHYTKTGLKAYKETGNIERLFDGQAYKFNYFSRLNDKTLLSLIHTELIAGEITKETQQEIKEAIVKELNILLQEQIKETTNLKLTEESLNIPKGKLTEVVGNFALNRFLYNIELSKLLNGDGAFYKPGDLAKRTPQSGAFITSNNTKPGDSYKIELVKDVEGKTKSGEELKGMVSDTVAAEYDDVNYTDAQLIMTPEAVKKMLVERGTWLPEDEEAFKIAEGLKKGDKIPRKLRARLGAQKIFVYGTMFDNNLQAYIPVQIKCSVLTAFKVLEDVNPMIKDFREKAKTKGIDVLAYESTFKAAMPFRENIDNIEGSNIISMPSEFFGFQQDNPNHMLDDENNSLRQAQMLLPALATEDNKNLLLEIQATNIQEDLEKLDEELSDKDKFETILKEALTKRSTTENVEKALEMLPDGTFKIGLDTGFTSVASENLISSLYTNNVIKQSFKGGSGVQASALGFQFNNLEEQQKAVEKSEELSSLQTTLEYKYNKDNKSLDYVECAMPSWAKEFFDVNGFLRTDIPDNLKQLFCYRIPTEGAHSMLPLRVVSFLPETIGNYIILPFEITKQFGADFDFDKIYFIAPTFKEVDGVLTKVEYDNSKPVSENSREARDNKILDIYIETLQRPENLEMVMTKSGFDDLTNFVRDTLGIKKDSGKKNFYWGTTQDDLRERNHIAAALKGQANLHVTGHSYSTLMKLDSQTYNDKGEPTKEGTLSFDGKKSTNYSNKVSIEGKYISDEISQILAAALDDIKNPILSHLNLTKDTIDIACTIVRAGFGINTMNNFMTQPVLIELAERLKANKEQIKDIDVKFFRTEDLIQAYQENLNKALDALGEQGEKIKDSYKSNINSSEMETWRKFKEQGNLTLTKDAQHNYDLALYLQGQVRILNQYSKLENLSKGLKEINRFFAINKEVGPNMENIISQVDRYNIINSEEFPIKGFNISNIPALESMYNTQLAALDFLSTHFPYNTDLYNTLKNKIALTTQKRDNIISNELANNVSEQARTAKNKIKPEDRMLINGFIGAYLSQKGLEETTSFFSNLNREEQERILKEVPKKFVELNKGKLKNNALFKNLKTSFDKKSNTIFLQVRGNKLDISKKNLVSDAFQELWNSKDNHQFAEDLLKYTFMYSGLFSGLNSFHQFIPVEIMEETGYSTFKKTILNKLNNGTYNLTIEDKERLTDQLIRNFPDRFVKSVENIFTDNKTALPKTLHLDITKDNESKLYSIILDTYPSENGKEYITADYFKVFDNTKKDFVLYKQIGELAYTQVDILGKAGRLIEIDPNTDIKTSILTKNKVHLENTIPKTDMLQEQEEAYNERYAGSLDEDLAGEEFQTPTIEDTTEDFVENNNLAAQEEETKAPETKGKNQLPYYEGDIKPDADTIFVFGSNPEGRHGAGAAKVAVNQFGATYGQGEGLQGNAYALPTKDLRVKENSGFKSISPTQITDSIKKLYQTAKENPTKQFKIAYRNTTEKSLNGYTGLEMIDMFKNAGEKPSNIIFSKEWVDATQTNPAKSKYSLEEDLSDDIDSLPEIEPC